MQTNETYWNKWHWAATPVYVPARESIAVHDDLATIHASAIGKRLLSAFATGRHPTKIEPTDFPLSSGPITESPMKPGYDPRDPTKGGPPTVSLAADDDLDVLTLPLEQVRGDPPEPVWNPTPRHVAVSHEVVHAYHHVTGTATSGPLSATEAVHKGDVGVSHSEYQATGIDTADGVRTYAADEIFSENRYRAELGLHLRNSYIPEGFRTQQAPTGFKDEQKGCCLDAVPRCRRSPGAARSGPAGDRPFRRHMHALLSLTTRRLHGTLRLIGSRDHPVGRQRCSAEIRLNSPGASYPVCGSLPRARRRWLSSTTRAQRLRA